MNSCILILPHLIVGCYFSHLKKWHSSPTLEVGGVLPVFFDKCGQLDARQHEHDSNGTGDYAGMQKHIFDGFLPVLFSGINGQASDHIMMR